MRSKSGTESFVLLEEKCIAHHATTTVINLQNEDVLQMMWPAESLELNFPEIFLEIKETCFG